MQKIIGYTAIDLDTRFENIRTKETNFSNFYMDIIREELNADIALANAGTVRSDRIIPAGPITYEQLNKILP